MENYEGWAVYLDAMTQMHPVVVYDSESRARAFARVQDAKMHPRVIRVYVRLHTDGWDEYVRLHTDDRDEREQRSQEKRT